MAITSQDKLIAALFSAQKRSILKFSELDAVTPGRFMTAWTQDGTPPAGNGEDTEGALTDKDTTGAIALTNAATGQSLYLLQAALTMDIPGTIIIYDKLWNITGLTGQETDPVAIPDAGDLARPDALGAGVELWAEMWTPPDTGTGILTVLYTNQAGVTNREATYTRTYTEVEGEMVPLVLQSGDTGVRKVTGYYWSEVQGVSPVGNIGLVMMRRIAEIPVHVAHIAVPQDYATMAMPKIENNACLAMMVLVAEAAQWSFRGSIAIGQG